MKFVKAFIILVLGMAIGVAGGGYFGYHIGKTDNRIDTAPTAAVIPVQQETHHTQAPAPGGWFLENLGDFILAENLGQQ